jgi:hypothetical protein
MLKQRNKDVSFVDAAEVGAGENPPKPNNRAPASK